MEQKKKYRILKVAKEFGIGATTLLDFFKSEGIDDLSPNSKIDEELYSKALKKFGSEKQIREKIKEAEKASKVEHKSVSIDDVPENQTEDNEEYDIKNELIIKDANNIETITEKKDEEKEKITDKEPVEKSVEEPDKKKQEKPLVEGPKILGKIELNDNKTKKKDKKEEKKLEKQKETKKIEDKKIEIKEPKNKKAKEEEKKETQQIQEKTIQQENNNKIKTEEKTENKEKQETIQQEKQTEKIEKNTPEQEQKKEKIEPHDEKEKITDKITGPKVLGKIDLSSINQRTRPDRKTKEEKKALRDKKKKEKQAKTSPQEKRKERKRRVERVDINKEQTRKKTKNKKQKKKQEVLIDPADIQKKVKETLKRLEEKQKFQDKKLKQKKKDKIAQKLEEERKKKQKEEAVLKVSEFITLKELAALMSIPETEIISFCMDLGQPVTINYRLDSELIKLIADEFNYQVEFIGTSDDDDIEEILKSEENQKEPRPPIVTVMGHVDHGKTSLLDYIRKTNIAAKEAGGITQHIGASLVKLPDGRIITFIDTPGHEAFTAMRARGTQVTDIAVIIIAADDNIMPQTEEAIDHARAANVPMIFAINKIDKPGANPERIKQALAERNLLIEDWGGKYGCVEISAKTGEGVDELLDRILLEAEMLELKANPDRDAIATVLEARLDKGRGYIANIIVRTGTLHIGDIMVSGAYYGKVKSIFNEFNQRIKSVGPSYPAQILGLNGAPEPGEALLVVKTEKEAKERAERRMQILREMEIKARKKHSLEEISRMLAEGEEKTYINFIIKADVKGSLDAIINEINKLSTDEVTVHVVHGGIGRISESDVTLAQASNAIIIGFNVRPSLSARKLAEKNHIEIRLYSVIYDIENDIEKAIKGMLKPETKEEIIGTAEVLNTFKISKVGTVAGCMVRDGKIVQNAKVRLIRDGVVIYEGQLSSLKRFKDDVKEVQKGYDCGMMIDKYNDIKVGDFIEAYEIKEVER